MYFQILGTNVYLHTLVDLIKKALQLKIKVDMMKKNSFGMKVNQGQVYILENKHSKMGGGGDDEVEEKWRGRKRREQEKQGRHKKEKGRKQEEKERKQELGLGLGEKQEKRESKRDKGKRNRVKSKEIKDMKQNGSLVTFSHGF